MNFIKCTTCSILFTLLLAFASFASYGQSKTVTPTGKVKDEYSGNPVPYANIAVKSRQGGNLIAGTITNEEGSFTLAPIATGTYSLEINSIRIHNERTTILCGRIVRLPESWKHTAF